MSGNHNMYCSANGEDNLNLNLGDVLFSSGSNKTGVICDLSLDGFVIVNYGDGFYRQYDYNAVESFQYIQKINEKYEVDCQGDDKHKLEETKQYNHYFKDVSNLKEIDIYRVLDLWNVSHPCLQHAAKKILVAGNRGHKDITKDIQEAIDSLERWKEMQVEGKGNL